MDKPGVERAIPGAIFGIVTGVLAVIFLRWVSGFEPYFDFGSVLVLVPFTMMTGWMWGIGAFNPRWSEHVHPPGEHDDHEEEDQHEDETSVAGVFMNQIWQLTTYALLFFIIFFAIAKIPTSSPFGFFLRVAGAPEASFGEFASDVQISIAALELEFTTSQIWIFLGMVAITVIPLALLSGVIAFALYFGHREVLTVAEMEPTPEDLTPPAPVRGIGRIVGGIGSALRRGIPRFFGMR